MYQVVDMTPVTAAATGFVNCWHDLRSNSASNTHDFIVISSCANLDFFSFRNLRENFQENGLTAIDCG